MRMNAEPGHRVGPLLLVLCRTLYDYKQVFIVWGTHDLYLFGADTEERQVIARVKVAHDAACFLGETTQQTCILHSGRVVQSCADRDAIIIDDNGTNDTFVCLDPLQTFIYFRHLSTINRAKHKHFYTV